VSQSHRVLRHEAGLTDGSGKRDIRAHVFPVPTHRSTNACNFELHRGVWSVSCYGHFTPRDGPQEAGQKAMLVLQGRPGHEEETTYPYLL
jgi:hypothetical protein